MMMMLMLTSLMQRVMLRWKFEEALRVLLLTDEKIGDWLIHQRRHVDADDDGKKMMSRLSTKKEVQQTKRGETISLQEKSDDDRPLMKRHY